MTAARPRPRADLRRGRRTAEHFAVLQRLPSPGKALTRNEIAVLIEIAAGLTNEQIARKLEYAPGTVSTMVQRILRKLKAPGRAAAVDRGWRLGYLGRDA